MEQNNGLVKGTQHGEDRAHQGEAREGDDFEPQYYLLASLLVQSLHPSLKREHSTFHMQL